MCFPLIIFIVQMQFDDANCKLQFDDAIHCILCYYISVCQSTFKYIKNTFNPHNS